MKKILCLLMALIMTFSLVGCGESSASAKPAGNAAGSSVQSVLEQQMQDSKETAAPKATAQPSAEKPKAAANDGEYDVDLTKLSSTMVYSEVNNIVYYPDRYIGKTIRMNGKFALYQAVDDAGNPIPDQLYFACIIADATACCAQGIEFVLAGNHIYPDDYPELGTEITVSGTFETYDENGYMYVHLVDAVFE